MAHLALSDDILMKIDKPARYIGNEVNCVVKDVDAVDIRFAMCFPDVYEIGMSHLGIQILYDMFNKRPDVWCERAYSPWPDLHAIMKERGIPLFALESQDPVRDFDFLGFTIQYEMCYTNILQVLDLSGIPLLAAERGEDAPIVIGGGPCTYNPEPLADFFDIFYIGEGETQYDALFELYLRYKHGIKNEREDSRDDTENKNINEKIAIQERGTGDKRNEIGCKNLSNTAEERGETCVCASIGIADANADDMASGPEWNRGLISASAGNNSADKAEGRHERIISRVDFLREAAKIPGLYVPSIYDVEYNEDGTIGKFFPIYDDVPATVQKQLVTDVTSAPYPERPIVPFIKATQDRVVLEIQRGCIRGCRFCQAGMIYRPTREKDVESLKDLAYKMLKNTGHEEISLSSLSSSDYSELEELVTFLVETFHGKGVNVSLPSLRIDAFSLDVMAKVQDVRKSSLTFAPEAGSQRLRDVINKGLTKDVILDGAALAFAGGWNKVKLYFMLGLPTETEEDMRAIPELANEIAVRYYEIPKEERNGKCQITISTAFFVPKPFTPFQWARMYPPEDYIGRAKVVNDALREQLNKKSMKYNWHEADTTVIEGVLARGDRRLGAVIRTVYEDGGIFDAWTDFFDYGRWQAAFEKCGINPDFYTMRERGEDEIFPWDFIDIGVTKSFLRREWERAMAEEVTPNCRVKCSGCGAGKFGSGICVQRTQDKQGGYAADTAV